MIRRVFLTCLLAVALVATAAGDGLILNDGRKLSGRVVEKPDRYEIAVDGQTLTFAKDDVARWVKTPKDLTAEAEPLIEEAKKIYAEAVELKDAKAAEARFREALPKVIRAREALSTAREFFVEGYPDLDEQLLTVMKLMRLVRERIGAGDSEAVAAKAPATLPAPKVRPVAGPETVKSSSLADALAVMADPARRADPAQRGPARLFFRGLWEARGPAAEAAAAAYLFLSRDDKEWLITRDLVFVDEKIFRGRHVQKSETLSVLAMPDRREVRIRRAADAVYVTPPGGSEFKARDFKLTLDRKTDALEALQKFFAGLDAAKFPDAGMARPLAARVKELRAEDPDAPVEALALFACGLSGGSEFESGFKDLGFAKSEFGGVWGRKESLALHDFHKWVAMGEHGLAVVQFKSDYGASTDFGVRYALGLLFLLRSISTGGRYDAAAAHFDVLSREAPCAEVRDHLTAMAKSIRDDSPCAVCGGSRKINCGLCRGKGRANFACSRCNGSGTLSGFGKKVACDGCEGQGKLTNAACPKCKATGKIECKARGCSRETRSPTFENFAGAVSCALCRGKGSLLSHAAWACPDCAGVGLLLQPKAAPTKTLR